MCDYCDCRSHPQIAALSSDHDVMTELLADLRRAVGRSDAEEARALTSRLHELLERHTTLEERGVFSELLRADVDSDYVAMYQHEHDEVHLLLDGGSDPDWQQRAEALIGALGEHIYREETDLFPAAHQLLRPDQWDAVDRVASSLDATLGDLVVANPAAARVLDALGLDDCCHGDRSLVAACDAAGLDAADVAATLADLDTEGDTTWATLDAPSLAAHIVDTHHRYLHAELPLLEALAAKVVAVHGARHPELADVHRLVAEVRADLEPHLMKEERVLFPAIEALATGPVEFPFGPVANPIRMMLMEHDRAGELLAGLRAASGGYTVPDDACASYRSLYERLEALELDTHLHIHKENHVLFPAALRLAEPAGAKA